MFFETTPSRVGSPFHRQSTASTGRLFHGEIFCTTTIEQTTRPNRLHVCDLLGRPLNDEDRVSCFVPIAEFDREDSAWKEIDRLPGIHVVQKFTKDEFEVAVAESFIPWLRQNKLPFSLSPDDRKRIFDDPAARRRADTQFIRNASMGLQAQHGTGLKRHYRRYPRGAKLRILLEWVILICDIRAFDARVLDKFYSLLSYLSNLLAGRHDKKDSVYWTKYFQTLRQQKENLTTENLTAIDLEGEMHDLALLQGLFESVRLKGGKTAQKPSGLYCGRFSANENLWRLGRLLGVEGLVRFGASDMLSISRTLSQAKLANDPEPLIMMKSIRYFVPVAAPEMGDIPTNLAHNMRLNTIQGFMRILTQTFIEAPLLQRPENCIRILVCHGTMQQVVDPALQRWAASGEGSDWYQQSMADLHALQPLEQKQQALLSILALLSFQRLLLYLSDGVSGLFYRSYSSMSGKSLNGEQLKNERAILERIALSIDGLFKGHWPSVLKGLLEPSIGRQHAIGSLDDYSDEYPFPRHRETGHKKAWEGIKSRPGALLKGSTSLAVSENASAVEVRDFKLTRTNVVERSAAMVVFVVFSTTFLITGWYGKKQGSLAQFILALLVFATGGAFWIWTRAHCNRRQTADLTSLDEEGTLGGSGCFTSGTSSRTAEINTEARDAPLVETMGSAEASSIPPAQAPKARHFPDTATQSLLSTRRNFTQTTEKPRKRVFKIPTLCLKCCQCGVKQLDQWVGRRCKLCEHMACEEGCSKNCDLATFLKLCPPPEALASLSTLREYESHLDDHHAPTNRLLQHAMPPNRGDYKPSIQHHRNIRITTEYVVEALRGEIRWWIYDELPRRTETTSPNPDAAIRTLGDVREFLTWSMSLVEEAQWKMTACGREDKQALETIYTKLERAEKLVRIQVTSDLHDYEKIKWIDDLLRQLRKSFPIEEDVHN